MNARNNPFSSGCIDSLPYHFMDTNREELLLRLAALNCRAAIVGPEGSGKTTLLAELGRQLEKAGYRVVNLRFDRQRRSLTGKMIRKIRREKPTAAAFLIDGVEQLSRFSRMRLRFHLRRAGAVVVTSHGLGWLPVLVFTRTSPELLSLLVDRLLGVSGALPAERIRRLYRKYNGNIRLGLRELYDEFTSSQNSGSPADPEETIPSLRLCRKDDDFRKELS
ncbi:MAG: hypothetical protein ACOZF0_18870 [Thermodesulfobacteriota bacterium]